MVVWTQRFVGVICDNLLTMAQSVGEDEGGKEVHCYMF